MGRERHTVFLCPELVRVGAGGGPCVFFPGRTFPATEEDSVLPG